MLFRRLGRNKKGLTLVEMIVAIAVTAILAVALSTMMVPIMTLYSGNRTKSELQEAVVGRLNDFAMQLRGATGVYVSDTQRSFFNKVDQVQYDGCRKFKIHYAIAQDNYYEANSPKIKGYRYPEMKVFEYGSSMDKAEIKYASSWGEKLVSDDFQQDKTIYCPKTEDFYFYVRNDANGRATCIEMHLTFKKGDVTYEGIKSLVCENLVLQPNTSMKGKIFLASFVWNNSIYDFVLTPATVSSGSTTKKYYSVWFSKEL